MQPVTDDGATHDRHRGLKRLHFSRHEKRMDNDLCPFSESFVLLVMMMSLYFPILVSQQNLPLRLIPASSPLIQMLMNFTSR